MFGLCLQLGDEESREQLIKTHYMARVGELTTQLQISDSKAVHFHSEVKPLTICFLEQRTDLFSNSIAAHLQRETGNFSLGTVRNCSLLCPPYNHSTTIFVYRQ